jgi:hypothetical protein
LKITRSNFFGGYDIELSWVTGLSPLVKFGNPVKLSILMLEMVCSSTKSQHENIRFYIDGTYELPAPYINNYICFTKDGASGPFHGVVTYARSAKGNEWEMRAPFRGFLLNKDTDLSTLQLGMTINISFLLETSPEYSIPQEWCTDTAPIIQ